MILAIILLVIFLPELIEGLFCAGAATGMAGFGILAGIGKLIESIFK